MKMNKTHTNRGFGKIEFTDRYGVKCSIQESSLASAEGHIWFGANDIGLKHFKAYEGWKDVELVNTLEEHYVANNQMHLSQSMVRELLPILQKFADTGEL